MANFDYILQGFNVFVNGVGKLGSGEKLQTPKITKVNEKARSGGMLGTRKIYFGYDVFEFQFSLSAYDPQVIAQAGLFSKKQVPLSFAGFMDGDRGVTHSMRLITLGEFEEIDAGEWEAGKKAMLTAKGSLTALKLTVDGAEVYDIDLTNDVYVIGGVDEYAAMRAALN